MDEPWRTGLLEIGGGRIAISGGPSQGLQIGDTLIVLKRGELVKNPQYGTMMNLPGVEVARIRIESFFGKGISNEGAFCKVVSGAIPTIPIDQLVVEEKS